MLGVQRQQRQQQRTATNNSNVNKKSVNILEYTAVKWYDYHNSYSTTSCYNKLNEYTAVTNGTNFRNS